MSLGLVSGCRERKGGRGRRWKPASTQATRKAQSLDQEAASAKPGSFCLDLGAPGLPFALTTNYTK